MTDAARWALRREIFRVFGGGKCPPRERIASCDCADCDALCRAFAGVSWRKVPDGLIEAYPSKLPLFSPEAHHYFLPSYLLYALDHFTPSGPTEYVIYNLASTRADEDLIEWFRERLRPFTREEIGLAATFLDLVAADESFRASLAEAKAGGQQLLDHWNVRWNC